MDSLQYVNRNVELQDVKCLLNATETVNDRRRLDAGDIRLDAQDIRLDAYEEVRFTKVLCEESNLL